MMKLYILAGAALLAVGLLASTPNNAQAGKGGGGGHGFGHAGFHQPPGWSRGRKVGWRGGHLPPGLAKKGFR
jgi:hypothetical protein